MLCRVCLTGEKGDVYEEEEEGINWRLRTKAMTEFLPWRKLGFFVGKLVLK